MTSLVPARIGQRYSIGWVVLPLILVSILGLCSLVIGLWGIFLTGFAWGQELLFWTFLGEAVFLAVAGWSYVMGGHLESSYPELVFLLLLVLSIAGCLLGMWHLTSDQGNTLAAMWIPVAHVIAGLVAMWVLMAAGPETRAHQRG